MGQRAALLLGSRLTALLAVLLAMSTTEGSRSAGMPVEGEVSLLEEGDSSPEADAKEDLGSDSAALDDPDAYHQVPNFVFDDLSKVDLVPDRMACQRLCNADKTCRSYSYKRPTKEDAEEAKALAPEEDDEEKAEGLKPAAKNPPAPKGTCKYSSESLHYLLGWTFYTKAKDIDWQGKPHLTTTNFHEFPGLEYQESGFELQKDLAIDQCKAKCAKDPKCGAFSYNENQRHCRLAGRGVNYSREYTYYEKPRIEESVKSPVPSDQNAAILKSQERSAKKAASDLAANEKLKREIKSKREAKLHSAQDISATSSHKQDAFKRAEQTILQKKAKEQRIKDRFAVQAAFEKGYFEARGKSQEQKVKEVELKAMEHKHNDQMGERELFEKSGEYHAKRKFAQHQDSVLRAQIRIETAKESLTKVKNKQMERNVEEQDQAYDGLHVAEANALKVREQKHADNIEKLKQLIQKEHDQVNEEHEDITMAGTVAASEAMDRAAVLQKLNAHNEFEIKSLHAETRSKVAAIILNSNRKK